MKKQISIIMQSPFYLVAARPVVAAKTLTLIECLAGRPARHPRFEPRASVSYAETLKCGSDPRLDLSTAENGL